MRVKANDARETPVDVNATVPFNISEREVAACGRRSKFLAFHYVLKKELQRGLHHAEQVTHSGEMTAFYPEETKFESHASRQIF